VVPSPFLNGCLLVHPFSREDAYEINWILFVSEMSVRSFKNIVPVLLAFSVATKKSE
jgi:hypothetical protein